MKGYVVTLLDLPESVMVANRCIESGQRYNVNVELFPAVSKEYAIQEMEREKLFKSKWDQTYSNELPVIGNFISQYKIWKKIISENQGAIILEHDAVFVSRIPQQVTNYDIVNLGKPSFGKFQIKDSPGIYNMFSKNGGRYAGGAHGYYVSVSGAQQLINAATLNGILPCDIFLSNIRFPNIMECYPWPIEAHDTFTTIQKETGCAAKHNYNKYQYKIL